MAQMARVRVQGKDGTWVQVDAAHVKAARELARRVSRRKTLVQRVRVLHFNGGMWKPVGLVLTVLALLGGCATAGSGGPRLSSLAREVYPWPLRAQTADQIITDDRACEQWARGTKGPQEPFPTADLRYAVCMLAHGYEVGMAPANVGPPRVRVSAGRLTAATRDEHVAMLRGARADKLDPGSFDVPFGGEDYTRDKVLALMRGLGYRVTMTDMSVWPPPDPLERGK